MKVILLIAISFVISFDCISQSRKIPVFVGRKEPVIVAYLDSLNRLSNNPYYKIKRGNNDDGDLVLSSEYALDEENIYKCFFVSAVFKRMGGENVCFMQIISGSEQYAEDNLQRIKDEYKYISSGRWIGEYMPLINVGIEATFTRENKGFFIKYEITPDSTFSHSFHQAEKDWVKFDDEYILKYPLFKWTDSNGHVNYRTLIRHDLKLLNNEYERMEMSVSINCEYSAILFGDTKFYNSSGKLTGITPNSDHSWTKTATDFHGKAVSGACELYIH